MSSCRHLFQSHVFYAFKIKSLCVIAFECWTLNCLLIFFNVSSYVLKGIFESLKLVGSTFELAGIHKLVHYCSRAPVLRDAAESVKAVES